MSEERGTVFDTRSARARQPSEASVSAVKPGPSCEKTRASRAATASEQVQAA